MAIKQHSDPYYLDIKFGETFGKSKKEPDRLNYSQDNPLSSFLVVLDINRFSPSFRLKFLDGSGEYTQLTPFDSRRNRVRVGFNRNASAEDSTVLDFDILRAFPTSNLVYDIEGLLQVPNLYTPEKIRSFSSIKSVAEHLSVMALKEFQVDSTEISGSLNKIFINIVQPNWTNAELLDFLKSNLQGSANEVGYFCFIKCVGNKRVFVFKSLKELYKSPPVYYFKSQGNASYDSDKDRVYYPILDFKVYDNYKLLGAKGVKNIEYSHFDYLDSSFKQFRINLQENEFSSDDFLSLTKFFCIDGNDPDHSFKYQDTGRYGTSPFGARGTAKNMFYKRVNNLSKIWIVSMGLEDIQVGNTVSLEFLETIGKIGSHQYNGVWMVERVIHSLGTTFGTRLLLTRNGMDTSEETTLVAALPKNMVKK